MPPWHHGTTTTTTTTATTITTAANITKCRGKNAAFKVGGMPHVTKQSRKPEPLHCEFKVNWNVCHANVALFDIKALRF
jgi:hypothetical protein